MIEYQPMMENPPDEDRQVIIDALISGPKHWSEIVGFRSKAYVELEREGIITKQKSTGRVRLTPTGRARYGDGGDMYRKNWPQEMSWWDKYKATMTGKHDEKNPPMPVSAVMEVTIALNIVREVYNGQRPIDELEKSIRLLEKGIGTLRESHKGKTDWQNPPAVHPVVEIYRDIVEIRAIKPNGQRYVHKFGKGSNIYGMSDGTILVRSRKGKRLWKNFKTEG